MSSSSIDPDVFLWLCGIALTGGIALVVVVLIAHSLRNGKVADDEEAESVRASKRTPPLERPSPVPLRSTSTPPDDYLDESTAYDDAEPPGAA